LVVVAMKVVGEDEEAGEPGLSLVREQGEVIAAG
jgi:hypothetical protein